MHTLKKFQVSQLRQKNQTRMVESIAVFMATLFVTAFLPSLLVRYVYAGQQLLKQPVVLEYIPLVSFVIAAGYFIRVVVTNVMAENYAQKLEKEMSADGKCDCSCMSGNKYMNEMGSLAAKTMKTQQAAKSTKKSISRKKK